MLRKQLFISKLLTNELYKRNHKTNVQRYERIPINPSY